jgi:two-component system, LytTR family, sensor histidine kinase AlgZ
MKASLNQTGSSLRLPNFCNMGVMLRTLLAVNVLFVLAAAVRNAELSAFLRDLTLLAAFGELPLIFGLVVLCALRRFFEKLHYAAATALVLTIVLLIGLGTFRLMTGVLPATPDISLPRFLMAFVGAAAIVLLYLDLRSRALNPAVTQARLQALQARIRPHFLFNTLNSAASLIRNEPKRAESALLDLAELFRAQLADNRSLTPVTREVELAKQYLNLEQLRLGDRLVINWHIDSMPRDALVPPLLLQPLVENAVAHGIEPIATSDKPGVLDVSILLSDNRLVVRLANPYDAAADKHQGNKVATGNIRERLSLHFDAEAQMQSHVVAGKYTCTITIPYTTLKGSKPK